MSVIRRWIAMGVVGFGVLGGGLALGGASALAAPEAPVTETPAPITSTTATLKGELNPGASGEKVKYHFAYNQGTECTGGLTAPAEPFPEAEDNHKKVSAAVTNLEASTEYTVCLIAANPANEAESEQGTSVTFKTPASKPIIAGESVSGVNGTEATLEAQVNPENQETPYSFEYATSEAAIGTAGATTVAGALPIPAGGSAQRASVSTGAHLAPGVTYYYLVIAENATGEAEGVIEHFTTPIEAPRVQNPTSVTGTSAVLNGKLNPNASGTAGYYFNYNAGPSCEGGFTTTPSGPVTGKGVIVHENITALEALTEYTFCVFATSPTETLSSAPKTFVTAASAPVVLVGSESVTGGTLTPYAVTLEAQANPENELGTCVFEYGETNVSEHSVPCAPPTLEGSGNVMVTASLTGLEAHKSYKYRVVVANATGKAGGKEETFETLLAVNGGEPEVESESSLPAPFETEVKAQVNPDYRETLCKFEYASEKSVVTEGKGTKVPCNPENLGSGGSATSASANLTGLSPVGTYYYRVVVENTTNKKAVDGKVEPFNTPVLAAPKIESESYSAVSPFEENLEARVNPEYQETKCKEFEYTTEAEAAKLAKHEGTKVPCSPEKLGSGGSLVSVSARITGLNQNTSYSYDVVVENATGEANPLIEQFKTRHAEPPEISPALFSQEVTPFGATVGGYIDPEDQETSCEYEYSTAKAVVEAGTGEKAPCRPEKLGNGNGYVEVFAALTNLTPGKLYYYRSVAKNASGVARSEIGEFATETENPPTVESESTSEVTALHAKLDATINPDYQKTTVTFEYSSKGSAFFEGTATKVPGGTIAAGLGGGQGLSIELGADVLQPGKTYFYRVIAENATSVKAGEVAEGKIEHFMVSTAPVLTTAAAQNVAPGSVTLSGTVNPGGGEKTKYHYAYISLTNYNEALGFGGALREINPTFNPYAGGSTTPEVEIEGTPNTVLAAQPVTLTGLTPGAEYHYALVATNSKVVGFNENNEPIYAVASTVISSGATFTVEGTPTKGENNESTPVYPIGSLGAPAATTPIPLLTVPSVTFPKEEKGTTRKATNAEKLKSALRACKKKHPKSKRTACEKQARKRYAAKPKKKKK